MNAGQSVVILMVISRINGLEDAGIFSIANAIASLMLTVGNFGMRNYQVTDINEKYSFCNYISSRICTDVLMFLGSLYYIMKGWLLEDYSFYKMAIILSTKQRNTLNQQSLYPLQFPFIFYSPIRAKYILYIPYNYSY